MLTPSFRMAFLMLIFCSIAYGIMGMPESRKTGNKRGKGELA